MSDVFDNSIYPLLFATYLEAAVTGGAYRFEHYHRVLLRAACLLVVTVLNYVNAIGTTSVWLAVLTLSPFVALFVTCLYQRELSVAVITDFEPASEVCGVVCAGVGVGLIRARPIAVVRLRCLGALGAALLDYHVGRGRCGRGRCAVDEGAYVGGVARA
jgi:hypothetical protein